MPQSLLLAIVAVLSAAIGASLTAVVMEQPPSATGGARDAAMLGASDRGPGTDGPTADASVQFEIAEELAEDEDAPSRSVCLASFSEEERRLLRRAERSRERNGYHQTITSLRREKKFDEAVEHALARWDEPAKDERTARRYRHDVIRALAQLRNESPRADRELERIQNDHASEYAMYGEREAFELAYSAATHRDDGPVVLDLIRSASGFGDSAPAARAVRRHLDVVLEAHDAGRLLEELERPQDLSIDLVQSASNTRQQIAQYRGNRRAIENQRDYWARRYNRLERMASLLEGSGRAEEAAKVREHLSEFREMTDELL
ncbi:hypothetical protein HK107_06820 [Parvularcula sp. ZS-1/3]|uniref:Secreted protein n=1 Tax=Parvularcula mediterranea TaxID=2732508 RepID=A0A7Y3RM15_9PROT|nr:hypothetical protein [Parvularcula mediterranea]NNU16031.1 hypothetical protein [Parvularcula mediterranea]